MPLLEPITFFSAPVRGEDTTQLVDPEKAEDLSMHLVSSSLEARSMMDRLQSLVVPPGINSFSRSDPPTPPRGPPPTPRRRATNKLSKSDPPTPPRGPPPTPRRRDSDMFNSLSRRDPPSPPNGPPPTPHRHGSGILGLSRRDPPSPPSGPPSSPCHSEGFGDFNSLSRRDPPTPPSGPPPSPHRRDIFNDFSRRDPPSPPRGPPPSPQRRGTYNRLSRSDPPSPPRGPPPTPGRNISRHNTWTSGETDLLMFVCASSVKLGWYQIAGLFHGKDEEECMRKYRETQKAVLDQADAKGWCSDDSKSYCEPLQLCIPTDDPVPGLSRGPSPVGSPVYRRLSLRSWEFCDVECAVDVEMPRKTIAHLSDELNLALQRGCNNVMDRIQDQHAFPQYPNGAYWTTAPGLLQMPK